jgi:hypothetical protein
MDTGLTRAALYFEGAAERNEDFSFAVFRRDGAVWIKINDREFPAVRWKNFDANELGSALDVWVFDECNRIGRQDIADQYRRIKK